MSNRQKNIHQLIIEADDNMNMIKEKSVQMVNDTSIQFLCQTKVFSVLNALRSCLEYCAKDIYEIVLEPNIGKYKKEIHFPYGNTYSNFTNSLNRNQFDQLKKYNITVYKLIESIQAFIPQNDWLYWLCLWNNDNKHNNFTEQKRVDGHDIMLGGITLKMMQSSKIEVFGDLIIGNKHYGPATIKNGNIYSKEYIEKDSEYKALKWTYFIFTENGKKVLDFLEIAFTNINKFQNDLYQII